MNVFFSLCKTLPPCQGVCYAVTEVFVYVAMQLLGCSEWFPGRCYVVTEVL